MTKLLTEDGQYAIFVLSVDDLGWTRHWLGRRRCDQLLVYVATSDSTTPLIRIRALESKSSSKTETIQPASHIDPFTEAVDQVASTLDALWRLIEPEGQDQLVEDLRFSAFVEHLASVALTDLFPIEGDDTVSLHVLAAISDFSLRRPIDQIQLDGVAVCTQYRVAGPRRVVKERVSGESNVWDVYLVRAGAGDVDRLVGAAVAELVVESTDLSMTDTSGDTVAYSEPDGGEPSSEEPPDLSTDDMDRDMQRDRGAASGSEAADLSKDLYLACQHRGFRVLPPDPGTVVVGPSLISIPMQLEAGASIKPIEQVTEDLSREIGATSVSVENDPNLSFHVRFLVARSDRIFPNLPQSSAPLVETESQSYLGFYLGQTLNGTDFLSWLSSWPHMLIAGTSGSGKTTFIRSLLKQISLMPAEYVAAAVVDGKGEIDYFNSLDPAHFTPQYPEVLLGHQFAVDVLEWIVTEEIPRRRQIIVEAAKLVEVGRPPNAREQFTNSILEKTGPPFPALLLVIDEFAEIMLSSRGSSSKKFEKLIQQVTQVGRSILVHLVLATQRPDAAVVAGAIKANLDARVALRLPTHHDSMTVLGGKGAESLLGRGDLLFRSAGQGTERLQGYSA